MDNFSVFSAIVADICDESNGRNWFRCPLPAKAGSILSGSAFEAELNDLLSCIIDNHCSFDIK